MVSNSNSFYIRSDSSGGFDNTYLGCKTGQRPAYVPFGVVVCKRQYSDVLTSLEVHVGS